MPVTVEAAGVVFNAILRIGITAGINIGKPSTAGIAQALSMVPDIEAGIQLAVFANLAEFKTNVTHVPDDEECEFHVEQEYQVALGAKAGMSVAVGIVTYGPVAETNTPIWNTALASACAKKPAAKTSPATVSASATTTAHNSKRQVAFETTVLTSTATHTGVICAVSTTGNCPVSHQQTIQSTEVVSLTTTFASGGPKPTFPNATQTVVPASATATFGSAVVSFGKTSGSPVSYVAPPTSDAKSKDGKDGEDDDAEDDAEEEGINKKMIVGICAGIGIALAIGAVVGVVMWRRKKAYAAVTPHRHEDQHSLISDDTKYAGAHAGRGGFVTENTYANGGSFSEQGGRLEPWKHKPMGEVSVWEFPARK